MAFWFVVVYGRITAISCENRFVPHSFHSIDWSRSATQVPIFLITIALLVLTALDGKKHPCLLGFGWCE